jgi:hypothetical protein
MLEQSKRETQFWQNNWAKFTRLHPRQFVAQVNCEVVGIDDDYPTLVARLESIGLRRQDVDIMYIRLPGDSIHA